MNYLFLDNGFEEIEAITTIDLLRRAQIEVTTVSVTGRQMVMGAHNIPVAADDLIENLYFADAQMLILPGGATHLEQYEALTQLLVKHND
jgi:4-methyl-5(b-hydroxyethyl)-thiazole monophosphate biosynthesis